MLFDSETINSTRSHPFSVHSGLSQQDQQMTRSSLIVAATGLGKTVIMGGLARNWPNGRVMLMSHRYELNVQAMKQLSNICGEDIDLEQAGYFADQRTIPHRIVVASVQTLNSYQKKHQRHRFERFDPNEFGLLLIDEAHRAAAASYRRVVDYFRQNPDLCVVGVTATPDRLDKVGMNCVFENVACDYNLLWSVENGWLVPPKQKFVRIDGLDLSQVRTKGGDLDERQLSKLVEVEETLHAMAKPIVDICGERDQGIVFTASVAQAQRLAEMIRDYHMRAFSTTTLKTAVCIDGSMSPQDPRRKEIVADFKEGRIQFLVNCGVATEGFDAPNVRVVAIGRPTKSRALYIQMLGRGTRPLPGIVDDLETAEERKAAIAASDKPHCTVVDFVGQAGRHKLVCSTDFMVGETVPDDVLETAKRMQAGGDFDGTSLEALRAAREELERQREAARRKLTVGVDYELVDVESSYDIAKIPKVNVPGYLKNKPCTPKQKSLMLKLGFSKKQIESMNPRSASKAIDYAIQNPKTGVGRWLKRKKQEEAMKS